MKYSDVAEVKFDKSTDYDLDETIKRVKLEADKKVFSQLAKDAVEFIGLRKN